MSKKKPEGILMSPNNGGGSNPTGGTRPPAGEAPPVKSGGNGGDEEDVEECEFETDMPMEVVFNTDAFRKLILWTVGPVMIALIGAISAFFYFYHDTNLHKQDSTIHLTRGERGTLETKAEARDERKKLKTEITNHFDVKVREIKVEQQEQVEKLGKDLRHDQSIRFTKILNEVKKAHQRGYEE